MTWTTRQRSDLGGLAVIRAGSGPDILLLHGVGLRAEAWGAQLDALMSEATLTAPDMPGHGDSALPSAQMDLADYCDAAMAVLAALDGPALVIGHSMGAMIALDLAVRAPDHVCGVAALNAIFERSTDAAEAVQHRAASLDGQTPADPDPTLRRWFGATTSAERDACQAWLSTVDPAAYKMAYTAFAHSHTPGRDTLAQLHCPALFMTGSREPNSTPAMSRTMASLAPKGRAQIVEGAAHMMPMTHVAEVNVVLSGFFSEIHP